MNTSVSGYVRALMSVSVSLSMSVFVPVPASASVSAIVTKWVTVSLSMVATME